MLRSNLLVALFRNVDVWGVANTIKSKCACFVENSNHPSVNVANNYSEQFRLTIQGDMCDR